MTVLGLNAYAHDAGVALLDDGRPLFVGEEERFNRVRKTTAFPYHTLIHLERALGVDLGAVETVAFPWRPNRFLLEVAKLVLANLPQSLHLLRAAASPNLNVRAILKFRRVGTELARACRRRQPLPVRFVSHHLAHACTAFFLSPFDRAAVLVMDAFGDASSVSTYRADGTRLTPLASNPFFDSLGVLYSMVTKHLGFRTILDEGKVMALASYGSGALDAAFQPLVRLLADGRFAIDRRFFDFHRYGEQRPVSERFVRRFGPPRLPGEPLTQRHMDLAHALQHTAEETVLHVARHLRRASGASALCFTGGLGLNCLINGRLAAESGFAQVFVPPNPNDSGVALGAALAVHHLDRGARRATPREAVSPFLGPRYSQAAMAAAVHAAGLHGQERDDAPELAAAALAQGRLVGWYQGALEMGPRALGNRSILADPRDPFAAAALSQRVKPREYFRPYAPSVLESRVAEFFPHAPRSPYMSFAAHVHAAERAKIPAVVARDGTARVQTVSAALNPAFHRLIDAFAGRTGIPMVLNTSFNAAEPVVCTPDDAVRLFRASGLDLLVLGRLVVSKAAAAPRRAAATGAAP